MDTARKILTDEQAWKDLQYVSHTHASFGPFVAMCAALCVSVLLMSSSSILIGILLLIGTICMFPKVCRSPQIPAWNPNDPGALIYDTDVCIARQRRVVRVDCDVDEYYEATYEKAGYIRNAGMLSAGYPCGDDVQVGDRFYTVMLRDNPKAKQYYSMKEWRLPESRLSKDSPDEANPFL